MAKCIYGALFDWIVLKVNQALLAKKHNSEHEVIHSHSKPCFMIIIIMDIYHALINALGAHIIYINLNTIFCTYVEGQSYQNNLHKA